MSEYSLYTGRRSDGAQGSRFKACPLDIAVFAAAAGLVVVLAVANGLAVLG